MTNRVQCNYGFHGHEVRFALTVSEMKGGFGRNLVDGIRVGIPQESQQ